MGKLTYRRVLVFLCNALFIGFLIAPALGQIMEEKTQPPLYRVPRRPKVGLVLSGGGARGVAHVGVLKVLEELRVPVDFIAGASMGSLIGGIYASGMSPGEMENRIGAIDWDDIMSDQPMRQRIPWRQKRDDYKTLFGLEMGLRGGKILLPLGMTSGYKFEFVMTEFVGLEAGRAKRDFNSLPIPYRAVGTDLEDGKMMVFGSGSLVKAMRASMSIPAAFAPVEIDKRLYVDGGIVRNLPVDVARAAGCDIIIAVNLGTPPLRLDQVASAPSVALQTVNLMTEQNVKTSLGELTKKEVRGMAQNMGLPRFERGESQEICFIPRGDYRSFLRERLTDDHGAQGAIVDKAGRTLGRHGGIFGFTIGQRRGIGVPARRPYYVLKIEPVANRVVVGAKEDLLAGGLVAQGMHWVSTAPPQEEFKAMGRIRYRHPGGPCRVVPLEGGVVRVHFDEPQEAITPGQALVLYRDDVVLGGGWIREVCGE